MIGDDAITIRHSIPIPAGPADGSTATPPEGGQAAGTASYLLRSGSDCRTLQGHYAYYGRPHNIRALALFRRRKLSRGLTPVFLKIL
ncbi:MAG: hypothetical protein ACLPSH_02420 [Vulcanimicrobiaceae bacterium]